MNFTKYLIKALVIFCVVISGISYAGSTNQWSLKTTPYLIYGPIITSGNFFLANSLNVPINSYVYATIYSDGTLSPFSSDSLGALFGNSGSDITADSAAVYVTGGLGNVRLDHNYNSTWFGLLNVDGSLNQASYVSTTPIQSYRAFHGSVIYNGRLYVMGGFSQAMYTVNSTVEYSVIQPDHSSGPFGYLTPLPPIVSQAELCWMYNDHLYYMGQNINGTATYIVRTIIKADGTLSDWTTLAGPWPFVGKAAINDQNVIVMVERVYDATMHNKTHIIQFDPVKESFKVIQGPYTAVGRIGLNVVVSWKQHVYIFGGRDTTDNQNFLYSYEMLVPSVTPTKKINKLSANPSYGGVQLSWENPNQGDYAGTLVVSRTDRYPVSPTDGNMVYWYNGTGCNVSVPNGQKTYFGVFSHDTSYSFSSGTFVSAIPDSYQNISKASLSEPWAGAEVLSWANPTVTNQYDATIVLRRTDRYPNDPADGYNATDGTWFRYWYNGNGIGELGLTDTSYCYLLYANDTFLNFSSGVGGRHIPGWTGIPNVSQIASCPGYGNISISWVNPTTGNNSSTLIVRNNSHYPT